MSTDLDNAAYSTLNTYAILAASGITAVRQPVNIVNGYFGNSGGRGN